MQKHKCKLCLETFANGRALGGHMRSHMLNLYVNPKPKPPPHSPSPSPCFSSSEEIKTYATVRKRSKRIRRPESSWFGDQQQFNEIQLLSPEPVSSISDTSPEEAVAYCLIMLSRDKWNTDEEEEEIDDESESESDQEIMKVKRTPARNGYRCETCNRIFRSYQALGGHIASHKKVKLNHRFHQHSNQQTLNVSIEDKIHECHVCFKVFASGQALGGHKRSHVTSKQVVKQSISLFDLNLPAPSDNDDDDDD
ncbi:hypothetical protein L1987_58872 [Smallanthus sonchifolius]|uniref:Uncharacterized protein n=1 Tax=Smallanthus sonchifolius TaxID=185202 RepID=A0ACB9D3L0_9ASTR|nr:hypothetical protein L1987_58872 [Smallanthus sonchifolius]